MVAVMKIQDLYEAMKDPDGTYAAVKYDDETLDALVQFCKENNIPEHLHREDFHTTLVYSRKYIKDLEVTPLIDPAWNAEVTGFDLWESKPNAYKNETTYCLVMKLDCPELTDRFNYIMDNYDATYDFDEYIPHVTLSYNAGDDFDVADLSWDNGSLKIESEYSDDLNLGE
jgi:hypothetical protein